MTHFTYSKSRFLKKGYTEQLECLSKLTLLTKFQIILYDILIANTQQTWSRWEQPEFCQICNEQTTRNWLNYQRLKANISTPSADLNF